MAYPLCVRGGESRPGLSTQTASCASLGRLLVDEEAPISEVRLSRRSQQDAKLEAATEQQLPENELAPGGSGEPFYP